MARCYLTACIVFAALFADFVGGQLQLRGNRTLYILSFLSYPDNNTDLVPLYSDGPQTVKGAYLALESINNRTDLLWPDYELKLIETDDGCNISSKTVTNLVSHLYYSTTHIVGLIGPECTNSIEAVAQLTGRPEIALINIHFGNSPTLANRVSYPYSFGILRSMEIDVNALVALFRHNSWSVTAVLYDSEFAVDYASYKLFMDTLKGVAQVLFSSPVTASDIPLADVVASSARVIANCVLSRKRNYSKGALRGVSHEHDLPQISMDP